MMLGGLLGGMGLKMALLAAVVVAAGAVFMYIQILRSDLAATQQALGAQQTANAVQVETIKSLENKANEWKDSLEQFQNTLNAVAANQTEANQHSRELNDVLSQHDLTALSLAKPGLIERRINSGTADILRLFESETGGDQDNSR